MGGKDDRAGIYVRCGVPTLTTDEYLQLAFDVHALV
jgi:hypothetical protein